LFAAIDPPMTRSDRPPFRASERLGTTLRGKYRLDAVLGAGGMAVVYRAQHRNRAEFAVKMLLPALSHDEETRMRFLREGYAANSVKHPGAVLIVDDDIADDGSAFLVMELLDGVSVEELIERCGGTLPPEIVTMIGWQLLDVLASAHAAGVIHRDIKPANLFLTRRGMLKVLDFGIARVRDAASTNARATRSGVSFGTPAFMSPEQALGKAQELDHRTDVWSAGATMFAALAGRIVHDAPTPEQVFVRAATKPAAPLRSLAPSVPVPIAHVVDRALSYDAADRWASASDMRDELAAAFVASFDRKMPGEIALSAFLSSCPAPRAADVGARLGPRARPTHQSTTMPFEGERVSSVRNASPLLVGAISCFLSLMIGGVIAIRHRSESRAQVTVATQGLTAPAVSSTPARVSDAPRLEPAATTSVLAATLPTAASGTSKPATSSLHRVSAAVAAPKSSAHVEPTSAACVPPYTLDADGNKHFKPECFSP
jgi:eukaryotic-like serine/threonine-protein kinase